MIIVVQFHVVLHKVYRDTEAVPSIRNNSLCQFQNIIENILFNIKEGVSNLYNNYGKL